MATQVVPNGPAHAVVRRWPRYPIQVPVQLVTEGPTNVTVVQGSGTALNCGGMAVSCQVELLIGAQVVVEFTMPVSGEPVRARCFVRNRHDFTYGLEFIAENDSDYESVGRVETTLAKMATLASMDS